MVDICLVFGEAKASQTVLNVAKMPVEIISGHCTCMAGCISMQIIICIANCMLVN